LISLSWIFHEVDGTRRVFVEEVSGLMYARLVSTCRLPRTASPARVVPPGRARPAPLVLQVGLAFVRILTGVTMAS